MNIDLNRFSKEEKVAILLRDIFESYGYAKYSTSKIEEYGLYLENKNFLKSEQVITFNDLNGRLLAMRPDVTLSIAKNVVCEKGQVEKVFYNENVFRLAKHTKEFHEIGQIGLEAMGDIDGYTVFEVVNLALLSLNKIDEDFVLDVSHVGFVNGLLASIENVADNEKQKLLDFILTKNVHDLKTFATKIGVSAKKIEQLEKIISLNGDFESSIKIAKSIAENKEMIDAVTELENLFEEIKNSECANKIQLDFSILNDTSYYNGIIFQGYVKRIPTPVLSGGRYDLLMTKFGKNGGAIGFAIYLDFLARGYSTEQNSKLDMLVLYDENESVFEIAKLVEKLVENGQRVQVGKTIPKNKKFGRIVKLENGNVIEVKNV